MLEQVVAKWDRRRRARRRQLHATERRAARRLSLETLELRQMMAVTLGSLFDVELPAGRSVLVPLTGMNDAGGPITYEFSSSDPAVTLSLVSPTSKSLKLDVNGTDADGVGFAGSLVIRLFEDLAPKTAERIEELAAEGFYNGREFTRVIDGFMAQGGDNGSGGSGEEIDDEFTTSLSFVSRGLFAMANRGRDTGDSQFFITAVTADGSTNPIALADMPQHLNFRHTIFGQLVSGFETFRKIITTDVELNTATGETSKPVNDVTITAATVITDTQNAVLRVSAPESFANDDAVITVTARNSANETSQQTFDVEGVTDARVDPPFLGAVANQTTTAGAPVSLTLTSTDFSEGGVFYKVADATTFSTNSNVAVAINQSTGVVTLTPAANFTGTINLVAGVRANSAADSRTLYDTQEFTLTVNAAQPGNGPAAPTGLGVVSSSTSGPFDANGFVSTPSPMLTATAVSGATVQFKMGSTVIATGVETATGSGVYRATIPAGHLAVGANAITATAANNNGTSSDSTAFSVTYAPDYSSGIYVVPGAAGAVQQISMQWLTRNAAFANEVGYFVADSASGAVGGVAPSAANYAQAALNNTTRRVVFSHGESAGASETVSLSGGQFVVFYMIQNNTTANFLARNAGNVPRGNNNGGAPLAFFSITEANPDDVRHAKVVADATTGHAQYGWEDLLSLGDSDFNDLVMRVSLAAQSSIPSSTLHAPGAGSGTVGVNAKLVGGTGAAPGDIGVFFVDSPNGAIGSLAPGSTGYAAAALASANSRVLFASGRTTGATGNVSVPAGKYLAFYSLSNGSTANFLTANPTNNSNGSTVAMFSFDAANANQANHFRWDSAETQSTDPNATRLYIMDEVFGSEADFGSYAIDLAFASN